METLFRFADNVVLVLFFACFLWNNQAFRAQPARSDIFEKAIYVANVYKIPVLALFHYFEVNPTEPTYSMILMLCEACVHVIVYSSKIIYIPPSILSTD